jgi:homocysteine S-methyltransferase
MKNNFTKRLENGIIIFDGAMGTEIYRHDFFVNTSFDALNLNAPQIIKEIHNSYIDAGTDILTTNTFASNRIALSKFGLAEQTKDINQAGVKLAKECIKDRDILIAASVGPIRIPGIQNNNKPKVIIEALTEQINILNSAGADLIIFETLSDYTDIKYALEALTQVHTNIQFILSFSVDRFAKAKHGEDLSYLISLLNNYSLYPIALGLNCSSGPEGLIEPTEKLLTLTELPIIIQPNAGIPKQIDGRMLYMASPEYLATYALRFVNLGVKGVGGCCGTGPEHIKEIVRSVKKIGSINTRSPIKVQKSETVLKTPIPPKERSLFAKKLTQGQWVTSVEIVPPRGFDLTQTIEKAKQCKLAGIDAINIPDGPRASCRISPIITSLTIQKEAKIETVLHFCCRDKNLIGMQADLLGCAASNINNILFITGDPPKLGHFPDASAVFDADSIGMLKVQSRLNCGIDLGGDAIGKQTKAFMGSGADPNAIDMKRELQRTKEKIDAGAEFLITQPVFDVLPLLDFVNAISEFNIPVIAGIWPLASYRNAEFMKNEVPGVVVPDKIMNRMAKAKTKEAQRKEGIAIAKEAIEQIRDIVQGIQVSAPFGNVQTAIAVIQN